MKDFELKGKQKLIVNCIFWSMLVILSIIWIIDFTNVQNEKSPKFCISKKTHAFVDGTVDECVGLGYKVYEYDRESISGIRQFSPFYIKMKK